MDRLLVSAPPVKENRFEGSMPKPAKERSTYGISGADAEESDIVMESVAARAVARSWQVATALHKARVLCATNMLWRPGVRSKA